MDNEKVRSDDTSLRKMSKREAPIKTGGINLRDMMSIENKEEFREIGEKPIARDLSALKNIPEQKPMGLDFDSIRKVPEEKLIDDVALENVSRQLRSVAEEKPVNNLDLPGIFPETVMRGTIDPAEGPSEEFKLAIKKTMDDEAAAEDPYKKVSTPYMSPTGVVDMSAATLNGIAKGLEEQTILTNEHLTMLETKAKEAIAIKQTIQKEEETSKASWKNNMNDKVNKGISKKGLVTDEDKTRVITVKPAVDVSSNEESTPVINEPIVKNEKIEEVEPLDDLMLEEVEPLDDLMVRQTGKTKRTKLKNITKLKDYNKKRKLKGVYSEIYLPFSKYVIRTYKPSDIAITKLNIELSITNLYDIDINHMKLIYDHSRIQCIDGATVSFKDFIKNTSRFDKDLIYINVAMLMYNKIDLTLTCPKCGYPNSKSLNLSEAYEQAVKRYKSEWSAYDKEDDFAHITREFGEGIAVTHTKDDTVYEMVITRPSIFTEIRMATKMVAYVLDTYDDVLPEELELKPVLDKLAYLIDRVSDDVFNPASYKILRLVMNVESITVYEKEYKQDKLEIDVINTPIEELVDFLMTESHLLEPVIDTTSSFVSNDTMDALTIATFKCGNPDIECDYTFKDEYVDGVKLLFLATKR